MKTTPDFASLLPMMPSTPFAAEDMVVLVDGRGRRTLKRLHAKHRITIRGSVLRCDDVIGQPEGIIVGAGEPETFLVFRPTHADMVTEIQRPAEPIFTKDLGAILAHGDIRAGDSVIEVGTGAGILTIALLRAVGQSGHVTSYEIREDFAQTARENVAAYCGMSPNWRLVVANAAEGISEREIDRVILDVPSPTPVIPEAAQALRCGGSLIVYLPTILQVKELRDCLHADKRFALVDTIEVLERAWHFEARSVRPAHRMVAHTAFLTFARKTASDDQP